MTVKGAAKVAKTSITRTRKMASGISDAPAMTSTGGDEVRIWIMPAMTMIQFK